MAVNLVNLLWAAAVPGGNDPALGHLLPRRARMGQPITPPRFTRFTDATEVIGKTRVNRREPCAGEVHPRFTDGRKVH